MDVNLVETSGTTTYYGYSSDVETKNGDKSWSILRISQEVSTERVDGTTQICHIYLVGTKEWSVL
jgi:hypothetical protein